ATSRAPSQARPHMHPHLPHYHGRAGHPPPPTRIPFPRLPPPPPRTGPDPPPRRDPLHRHLRRALRRRELGADRRLCPLPDRLAQDLPHLARRHPLARYLPPRLLSARSPPLPQVFLPLHHLAHPP